MVHPNTQWWLKRKDGKTSQIGKYGRNTKFHLKWWRNQSLFEWNPFCLLNCQEITFYILISNSVLFYLGSYWLDILLWNVIWLIMLTFWWVPIFMPSSANSDPVGSLLSQKCWCWHQLFLVLSELLCMVLFITQTNSYHLADRNNLVHAPLERGKQTLSKRFLCFPCWPITIMLL